MAKNDWIVAGLNNPDFTPYDFSTIAELDLNNTQMLSAEEYMKSDFIKNHDMFKDASGNFSEDKFRQYHQKRLEEFGEFQEQEFPKGPQLDMFDTDRTKKSRVKDIRFDLGRHVNPDRQAVGIEGVRVWSDPTQTKSEIAQSQNIWDTKNKKFKDYSSNDKALSNGLFDWLGQVFSDPLVMAQWEEDGEHIDPITGLVTKHSKVDYKLNEKGTYYYETLVNRSPIGKEVLSVFDTLTVDGEGINKYDFFDSDDVKKSVTGVIAKNVAALLPLFPPVGGVYSALMVAKEFSKAMPMLYGWMTSLSDIQETPNWINKVAAVSTKFSGGTSQYAKENTFSFENFGNLIADVALQWGQQKAIANGINKLRGANTYVDDAMKSAKSLYDTKKATMGESEELWQACLNKYLPEAHKMATQAGQLGRDASLAYMAIVSNSDLYNEMRNMGLTNSEAAAISLGSTLGMFGLNKYTGLGEIFFDDATDDSVKLARKAIKDEMKNAAEMFKKIKASDLPPQNKILAFIKTASEKASGVLSKFGEDLKYHTLNFAGKAVGEGLEEVSEELISDVAKEIYQLAGHFGVDTTLKDVGAWDQALERYTMSFLGGAIGGGIFYGKEALIDGKSYKRDSKNWEMTTLIRNGHANELRAEIERLKKEGKIGSTTLSASKFEKNEKGERVWLTTESKEDSQNDAMANAMLDKINALEAVINNNRIGLTDEQLFENMVLTEKRYKQYEKIAPLTNYYQDFSNIVTELIAAELDLEKASATIEGTVNGTPKTDTKLTAEQEAQRQQQLLPLQQKVEELRKKKDEFLAGDTSLEYTRKLNFLMDPMLHSQFLSIDRGQFFKEKYGDRSYAELSPEERIKFELDWQEKVRTTLKAEVNESWESYKKIEALMLPELEALGLNTPEYKKFVQETEQLFAGDLSTDKLFESYLTYDGRLEGESDESYNARNTKLVIDGVEETDVEFELRRLNRRKLIDAYNTQKEQEWADKVNAHLAKVKYAVDPFTFRYLRRALPQRQRDIIDRKLSLSILTPSIRQIFKRLSPDLSNIEEIKQLVYNSVYEESKSEIQAALNSIRSMELLGPDGTVIEDLDAYVNEDEDGELTLQEIVDDPSVLNIQSPELVEKLAALMPVLGADTTLYDVVQVGMGLLENNSAVEEYVNQKSSVYENQLNTLISEIKTNPIYSLAGSIKTTVKNPIGELIKSLAAKNGDDIPNVDELLDIIQGDFENIEDVNQLLLDDTQMSNLKKVRDYMKLISRFMYAAASSPSSDSTFGHNRVINEYAQKHKDKLIKEWKPLPEIDSDYFVLYDQAIAQYGSEIDYWINLSNNNNVNKIRKFVATDRAFNIALYDAIKSRSLKFTVDDVEYDLLEGFAEGEEEPEVKLFNAEQRIHKNFQLALQKSGLSISEFLKKSGLLEKLIPSISNIAKQRVANLTDTLKASDLTDFDLIQYFAQIFAVNPSKFNSELKSRVKKNENIAPITAQEYATKLAQAITNPQYREIMKYAYELSGSELPFLGNTIILPGVAGAGKTAVVLSSVNDPNEEVIVAGPTKTQADKLQRSLHRTTSYTFNELLEKILGKDLLSRIRADFEKAKITKDSPSYESEFFTITTINGSSVLKLKRDAIKFNDLGIKPKKLFLDEATHLSTLEIQLLDAFSESIGAVNYLAGDPNQRGSHNKKAKTENIQEDQIFSSRAPKLSISLRDNNLQKYLNQESVRSLLDTVTETFLNSTAEELTTFWPRALHTLSKFNFKVYNHDVLNGDLITKDLSPELLKKIKGASVGFIGDKSSPYLQKLKEAGIESVVLSMDEMQGEEFDFVVVDQPWTKPNADYGVKVFLTDLYTTMTRARTASIFIDNGLSDIIGKNVHSDNKSQAPSILAGVSELRAKKLAILDKLQLDLEETTPEKTPEVAPAETPVVNPEEDFIDPEKKKIDAEVSEDLERMIAEEKIESEETLNNDFSADGEQVVETFTDITILGVEQLEHQKRTIRRAGKDIEYPDVTVWKVSKPSQGPLRNLQAFVDLSGGDVELVHYEDKQKAQRMLFDAKSAIIFQHGYDDLPRSLKGKFTKQDWERGTLELEIREVSATDTTHLNAKYKEAGFVYGDKRYVAGIVFRTKLRTGEEVVIDVSGLPSVDSYHANLQKIKENLQKRIAKATGDEKTALQEKLAMVDVTFANYANLFKSWIEQVEAGTFTPIVLKPNTINFNRTTWFQDLAQSERNVGIQLGGRLNPATGTPTRSRDNLQLRHPELVFSPIYTYAQDPRVFESMDYTLKGKAVVLVSSDTLLQPDQLLEEYINQKKNPESNTARVRMLVLDNYGMTFSQFIDKDFIKSFQKGDETRKPFRQNYTGIRMFTALWNWRAALIKFNEALHTWQTEHSYSDKQVEVLTQASQLVYEKKDASALLAANGLTTADLDNLNDFNTKYCENIPIFRLGYSTNGNGFYVRRENVRGSTVYDKDEVNLLAISPAKASQFQKLLDRILSSIEYSDRFGAETLGLRLMKETGEPWGKDESIDLKDAKHRRTLSGLLSDQSGKIILQADGHNIEYEGGNQWSMIPALISNLVRTITYFQHNQDQIDDSGTQHAKIVINKGEEKVPLKTQVGDLFTSHVLEFGDDSSLFDLLNLVFHGTTDDIHKKLTTGTQLMQVEDSYFKYGFFINPDIVRLPSRNGDYEIWNYSDERGDVLFYKIDTSEELFLVDTDVRTSGLGLRINELFKEVQEEESSEEEQEQQQITSEDKFKQDYPELSAIIELAIDMGKNFEFDLSYEYEAMVWYNNYLKETIKMGIEMRRDNVLDKVYSATSTDGKVTSTTFRAYIADKVGSDNIILEFGKNLTIISNGVHYTMDDDFNVTRIGETIEEKTSKYEQKLTSGVKFNKAFLDVLTDPSVRSELIKDYDVTEEDLDNLHTDLSQILNSKRSDDEISALLGKLEASLDGNNVYASALMPYLMIKANEDPNSIYADIFNILMNC